MPDVQAVDPRDLYIAQLEAKLAERDALIVTLLARIAALEAQVAALSRNSTNSSKPPSSDPPSVPKQKDAKSGKKRGAQPGHKHHKRTMVPPEQVNNVVPLIPSQCKKCGHALKGQDAEPLRHQVVELPPITPYITEYQQHALCCNQCGETTRASLPSDVPHGHFGPRLCAFIATCTAMYRMSKRSVRELVRDVLGVDLCLGSISNIEQQISSSLFNAVEEARDYVRGCNAVHADETSWREDKKKAWLWVAATSFVSVFVVAISRGGQIAKDMIGETFKGVLISDRWSAYHWVENTRRQFCWSHLIRDFQSWVDGGGSGAKHGRALLKHKKRMFKWWYKVRDGTMTREKFQNNMACLKLNVSARLTLASVCADRRVAGMANEILKREASLWVFVDTPGIEPTNNFAERTIRHAVLWRKGCFGTDSEAGSRFVERMLTSVASLRQQKRNVLEFMTEACVARMKGISGPSLLPLQNKAAEMSVSL